MTSRADLMARRAALRTRLRGGDARAALALARSLERDPPRDHGAARRACGLAAEAGLAEAMALLGEMLRDGRGGARDLEGAARWFAAAARRGRPEAMASLAAALQHGEGAPRDRAAAARLYRRAALAGHVPAMHELALCLRVARVCPATTRRRCAGYGALPRAGTRRPRPWSAWRTGGRMGAPRDRARAAPFLLAAARKGDERAAALAEAAKRRVAGAPRGGAGRALRRG